MRERPTTGIGTEDLRAEYRRAVCNYLDCKDEESLRHVWSLGRNAMGEGIEILELADLHHQTAAVHAFPEAFTRANCAEAVKTISAFCASCPAWALERE